MIRIVVATGIAQERIKILRLEQMNDIVGFVRSAAGKGNQQQHEDTWHPLSKSLSIWPSKQKYETRPTSSRNAQLSLTPRFNKGTDDRKVSSQTVSTVYQKQPNSPPHTEKRKHNLR